MPGPRTDGLWITFSSIKTGSRRWLRSNGVATRGFAERWWARCWTMPRTACYTGRLRRSAFVRRCERDKKDPEKELQTFLGPESSTEAFWMTARTNLQAGRIRLLF